MNSSMCFVSEAWNSPISRNVSTCRSGMTRRCVSAFGLMSWIATKPLDFATYVPSRTMSQKMQPSRRDGKDPLLRDRLGADADELAHRSVDEERRVVVAVAAARAVDEDDVVAAELRVPAAPLALARERAQPGAALLLRGRRHRV